MQELPQQISAAWNALAPRQRLTLVVTTALTVAAVGVLVFWAQQPTWGVLYTGLDPRDAQAVVQELQRRRSRPGHRRRRIGRGTAREGRCAAHDDGGQGAAGERQVRLSWRCSPATASRSRARSRRSATRRPWKTSWRARSRPSTRSGRRACTSCCGRAGLRRRQEAREGLGHGRPAGGDRARAGEGPGDRADRRGRGARAFARGGQRPRHAGARPLGGGGDGSAVAGSRQIEMRAAMERDVNSKVGRVLEPLVAPTASSSRPRRAGLPEGAAAREELRPGQRRPAHRGKDEGEAGRLPRRGGRAGHGVELAAQAGRSADADGGLGAAEPAGELRVLGHRVVDRAADRAAPAPVGGGARRPALDRGPGAASRQRLATRAATRRSRRSRAGQGAIGFDAQRGDRVTVSRSRSSVRRSRSTPAALTSAVAPPGEVAGAGRAGADGVLPAREAAARDAPPGCRGTA